MMKAYLQSIFVLFGLCSVCRALIVPNEIPTVLSLIYSNIPPLKIGQDTRFGIGFRLGPHADFQTLVEIGPQTNTGKLAEVDSPSKRQAQRSEPHRESQPETIVIPIQETAEPKEQKKSKKATQTRPKTKSAYMGKIQFKKIPGIDYR